MLAEYHHLANATPADTVTAYSYPSEGGWAAGIQHVILLNTRMEGSSNQASVRYGHGIANGGDGGSTKTWLNLWRTGSQYTKILKSIFHRPG